MRPFSHGHITLHDLSYPITTIIATIIIAAALTTIIATTRVTMSTIITTAIILTTIITITVITNVSVAMVSMRKTAQASVCVHTPRGADGGMGPRCCSALSWLPMERPGLQQGQQVRVQ